MPPDSLPLKRRMGAAVTTPRRIRAGWDFKSGLPDPAKPLLPPRLLLSQLRRRRREARSQLREQLTPSRRGTVKVKRLKR